MKRFKKLSDFSQSLNEDNLSGLANAHPWAEIEKMGTKLVKGQPIQLTANLFGTGIDRIDVNSTAFQDAVQLLRWLWIQRYNQAGVADDKLIVRGSASAVGSSSGYDNFALAQRRANNLVAALKTWFDKNTPPTAPDSKSNTVNLDWSALTKYIKISKDAVVGSATRKGSPEALAEQCVYLIWIPVSKQQDYQFDLVQPIDNVGVVLPQPPTQVLKPVNPDPGDEMVRCGCCGRPLLDDKYSWVMQRYLWALNELKSGWLKTKTGDTVYSWLVNMSKK
jgi:hypothetical protein